MAHIHSFTYHRHISTNSHKRRMWVYARIVLHCKGILNVFHSTELIHLILSWYFFLPQVKSPSLWRVQRSYVHAWSRVYLIFSVFFAASPSFMNCAPNWHEEGKKIIRNVNLIFLLICSLFFNVHVSHFFFSTSFFFLSFSSENEGRCSYRCFSVLLYAICCWIVSSLSAYFSSSLHHSLFELVLFSAIYSHSSIHTHSRWIDGCCYT